MSHNSNNSSKEELPPPKKKTLVRKTIKNKRDSDNFRRMGMESTKKEEIETAEF